MQKVKIDYIQNQSKPGQEDIGEGGIFAKDRMSDPFEPVKR
jgi:hypothetical protein